MSQANGALIMQSGQLIGIYSYATAGVKIPAAATLVHPHGAHGPISGAAFNVLPK